MGETLTKYFFAIVGSLAMTLGVIGYFLPLMPTTCFLIVAVLAFSRSNSAISEIILRHPQFGPAISNWMNHKSIDKK